MVYIYIYYITETISASIKEISINNSSGSLNVTMSLLNLLKHKDTKRFTPHESR